MDISLDKSLSDFIDRKSWKELIDQIPHFENLDTFCYIAHIALSQKNYEFLKSAVSRKDFPFYQKVDLDGKSVPILHRAIYARDLTACDIILSSGALALCCAQKCSDNCFDTLDILYEPHGNCDIAFSDVACLLISSWTKFLQKLHAASESGNAELLKSLLDQFKKYTCTFRRYTDLCLRLDSLENEDLREFTLLCMDPDSVPRRQNRISQNSTPSSTRNFFNFFTEGAGKALSVFTMLGDQLLGGGLEEVDNLQADLLVRRTRNVAAQLTQRFLNSMLISAIERADFPIIHLLLDFGFRLQSVPRPSLCFQNPVDVSAVIRKQKELGNRRNPIDWHLCTPGGPDWLLTALRVNEDTPFLAVIRKNLLQDNVFDRLLKEGSHLLTLPGAGGILPIHLIAALGRIEMLRTILKSCNPSLDLVDDCGLSALLISAFYGHNDCVCAILDHPCEETEMATSQDSDVSDEQQDPFLSGSQSLICPVDALKSAQMNWYFRSDGSNTLVVGAMRPAVGKHFIGASFNSLHLAILTGNSKLLECLLKYIKEDPEDYSDWLSDSLCTQTNEDIRSESTAEEGQLLANPDSAQLLCSPAGLACCLDDIDCGDQSLTSDILRLLSTAPNRKAVSPYKLLYYLLERQRFHLVGGLLYQQQHVSSRNVIDWSNRKICNHLNTKNLDSDIFSTLIMDWLSWSPLETITKLNISNNALYFLPLCLFVQLPALEELDLSRNVIPSLPDQASLEEFANASGTAVLAPNLTRLDLSSNFLSAVPPWLFGTTDGSKAGPRFAPRLLILRLCDNRLHSVPRQMWLARRLQCLDLSANALIELPHATVEEALNAATLRSESCDEEIDLNKERDLSCLPQLPNSFKVMSMFKSDKNLAIPNSLASISNVEPSSDRRWNGGLLHLWLQGNRLLQLPLSEMPAVNKRHSVTLVNDNRKSSQDICSGSVGLSLLAPSLRSLDVSGNRLSGSLPPPSRFPTSLMHLDMSNNQIISVGMRQERKLESSSDSSTDQGGNSFPSASEGQFKSLLHLNLRNNRIATFNPVSHSEGGGSDSCLWFPELASLDLSGNTELRKLGSAVCRLEKLSSLELDGCTSLVELPADLWRLSKLKSLILFNTPVYDRLVREIRAEEIVVRKFSHQRQRYQQQRGRKGFLLPVSNTPLSSNTSSKASEMPVLNTTTILEHLKSLPRSSKPYNKVRIMLIGSPRVGKTSLLKALLHSEDQDPHIKEPEDSPTSAAGLTVTPLRITRRCPIDHARNEWTDTVEFTVWDFHTPTGSAEEVESVLSAVQQFLMSKSTIYIVVWNATEAPDGLHIVAKHLVDIQTRASNAPVILVTTHNDLPSSTTSGVSDIIGRCFLRSLDPSAMGFSQQIVGHFQVNPIDLSSNSNLDAINRIATAIHSAANSLRPPFRKPLIGTKYESGRQRLLSYPIPLVYHDLEGVVRDLANDLHAVGIPPIVNLDDFVTEVNIRFQAGKNSGGLESQEETLSALTFLHEAGHILYFANFARAIVLDPLWLCDLLLRLLIHGTGVQPARAGVLNLSRLKDLLTSPKIPTITDPKSSGDIDKLMRRFQHLEVSFAVTYLVSLLAKFELVAPLDSQHLLVPALLPSRRLADLASKVSDAPNRQIRLTPLSNSEALQREAGPEGLLEDSDPLDCAVYTLPRKSRLRKSTLSSLHSPIAESSSGSSVSSMDSLDVAPPRKQGFLSKLASWQNNLVPKSHRTNKQPRSSSSGMGNTLASSSFNRSDKMRQPLALRQPLLPPWKLQAAPNANEVLRVYALSYVPAGFWTRLITRLLTDSDLNVICGHLYNLATVPPELRGSLLSLEKDLPSSQTLQSGWSLSRKGIQMTLAEGALPIFTLEQVGNRVSFATASVEETEIAVEANESTGMRDLEPRQEEDGDSKLLDEKSALGGLDEANFKSWSLYLMRFPTGCAEEFRGRLRDVAVEGAKTNGLIVEAFGATLFVNDLGNDFAKYCLIQIHMPAFSVQWPDYRSALDNKNENGFKPCCLHPDRRILAQILTKIVQHIDCLLEDWYPDLGTRFNQSNSGEYLVYRVIPCTDCVKDSLSRRSQSEEAKHAVSTLDDVLSVESGPSSDMKSNSGKRPEYSSYIIYGILVEELVHWLLTPARKQESLGPSTNHNILSCPVHSHATHSGISAPDLLFNDVRTDMKIPGSKVLLERFLGRGAFGSVFAGSAFFSATESPNGPSLLNLAKVPVGVKICSPINPSSIDIHLSDWQPFTDQEGVEEDFKAAAVDLHSGKSGTSDLRVAFALYRQEKRRWSFQPVEACYAAYQELRSELAVLMRVEDDIPISGKSSGCSSAPHGFTTFQRSNNNSLRSSRRATLRRRSYNYPKLFHHSAGSREFSGRIIGQHLLSCLGVVSPRPLSLLLPLAPKGSLSDWMEEMKASYETEGIYPVEQSTLTTVVHQVATAIAYLHGVRIVYRDLKPDNLLVWQMPPPITLPSTSSTVETARDLRFIHSNNPYSEVRVVLSDFGVSRWRASLDGCRGYVGTPGFMAPEVLASLGEETYTHKVDIYALGILMASIATFQLPYHGFTNLRFQLNQHILSGGRPDIPSRIKLHCSVPYLDLMSLCWSHEPQQRPEASLVVTVTQPPLPPPPLSTFASPTPQETRPSSRSRWRQGRLPVTAETGFDQISSVLRVDAVGVVTCAAQDSDDQIWIGGYSAQSELDDLDLVGDAFFSRSTSANRIGRLLVLTEKAQTFHCGLVVTTYPNQLIFH
ncbi:hypothetical protein Aperf_G00000117352 [Anoplocephala perfoliata]